MLCVAADAAVIVVAVAVLVGIVIPPRPLPMPPLPAPSLRPPYRPQVVTPLIEMIVTMMAASPEVLLQPCVSVAVLVAVCIIHFSFVAASYRLR